jgi:hypothetical protein
MTVIQLPDHQAAALKAKAEAQGLTLEAWLERLAGEDSPRGLGVSPAEAVERILEIQQRVKPDPEGWTVHDYIDRGRQ